jgi:hypothetical protein
MQKLRMIGAFLVAAIPIVVSIIQLIYKWFIKVVISTDICRAWRRCVWDTYYYGNTISSNSTSVVIWRDIQTRFGWSVYVGERDTPDCTYTIGVRIIFVARCSYLLSPSPWPYIVMRRWWRPAYTRHCCRCYCCSHQYCYRQKGHKLVSPYHFYM